MGKGKENGRGKGREGEGRGKVASWLSGDGRPCLSKAEVHFFVLRCLNVYSLKIEMYNYLFLSSFAGAALQLQLGAISARLVRLWVNPALNMCVT